MMRSYVPPLHDAAPSWVRRYYPIPNPLATFEQAERWQHLDVPGRSEDGLRAELNRITLRLLYDPSPRPGCWSAARYCDARSPAGPVGQNNRCTRAQPCLLGQPYRGEPTGSARPGTR